METEQGLFRTEAMDARRGQWLGVIQISTPLSRWIWTALGVALAAAIVAFLVFGYYTRRDRVSGQLVPSAGLLGVTAVHGGTVTHVFVHGGESVQQGEPLLEISGETSSAALGGMRADISRQLRSQRQRLQDDLGLQRRNSQTQAKALKVKLHLLTAQQRQIVSQLRLQKQQAEGAQALLKRIQPLGKKGYVSALQIQQQHVAALRARAQLKVLRRKQLSTRQQINATKKRLAQLPLNLAKQIHATANKIDDIDQQLARNEAARAVLLRAPQDGVVATLLAQLGQHVTDGQSLASIVPTGSTLQAQLLVPSRAVGFIEPGSRVVLRYQAYPYQKFGQQYGHVTNISRSALDPEEVVALTGRNRQQPVYRIRVALDHQSIVAYGEAQALKPGMALSADILMDRRTLLEWVFEPLYGMGRRLLGPASVSHG
ncbi:MAG TPA: HlyD family efflux transporter periplasmic adaptor subunit [Oleiagrimonas sp.]|nr:HlyD family efflux transporter periplasmic adaptor subunit [Oleiagrimonas sp.]